MRLRRDEPLLFKESTWRQGRAGEVFKVVRYDSAAGRVYVLATGSDGKPFALHVADESLEPAPKDNWALFKEALNAMQLGDLAGARARFIRAGAGATLDERAMKLALHCELLDKAAADLARARNALATAQPEIARLLRNAQISDRPPLIPGDTSGQVRAAEFRKRARELETSAQGAVNDALAKVGSAVAEARDYAALLARSGSVSIAVPAWDAVSSFAAKQLPANRQPEPSMLPDRVEHVRNMNAAGDALRSARRSADARQLVAALAAAELGLGFDPGRGDLKQLAADMRQLIDRARSRTELARTLLAAGRPADALAELEKAEAICADDESANTLGKQLRAAVKE